MKNPTLVTITLMLLSGCHQSTQWAAKSGNPFLKGRSALGDLKADKPGLRHLIRLQNQPPTGRSTGNFSEVMPLTQRARPSVPEDPRDNGRGPDLRGKVTVPEELIQAHYAPLQIAFYQASRFPTSHQGSAFMTANWSGNRSRNTAFKVVWALFDGSGKPTGERDDFMTGLVSANGPVWARLTEVAVAQEHSPFVTQDGTRTIWRVKYSCAFLDRNNPSPVRS